MMNHKINRTIPNGWHKAELGEILKTISPSRKLKTNEYLDKGKYPIVDQGKRFIVGYTNEENAINYDIPALIFGDHTKEVKLIDFPFAVGGDGVKILFSEKVDKDYLKFMIENAVKKLPELGYSRHFLELKNIVEIYPEKVEQQNISKILVLWDKIISIYQQKILLTQQRNLCLKNQLLKGERRFSIFENNSNRKKTKVGEIPEDWNICYISDVLKRVKDSVIPDPEKIYQEIGIRSHAKGIFYKEPVIGKSLGNKSVFRIEPECFIVNIVFAWEHAVAKTTENESGMIASHRFPMYKPKVNVLDLDYLLYFFKSQRGKHLLGLASPGGAGRNKTLGQSEFMKLQIPLPSIKEQRRISSVLSQADDELDLLEKKIEKLKEQKRGLMQTLLTGNIRIKS